MTMSRLLFCVVASTSAFDFVNDDIDEDALSLLQLRASKERGTKWVNNHGTSYLCELYGDPHVRMTFTTSDPETGNRNNQPDFNGGAGIFHVTKSEKCNLDMQMYNCPISRKSLFEKQEYGMTMIQGLAIKSGDDVIQVAYKPLDVSKYKLPELVGLTQDQWVQKVNDWCPEINTDEVIAAFNDETDFKNGQAAVTGDILRRYERGWEDRMESVRDLFRTDFHLWYRAYMYQLNSRDPPKRCEQTLWGTPLFPVVTVNGVEVPDWDTPCYSLEWWSHSFGGHKVSNTDACRLERQREIGGGIIQVHKDTSTVKPGTTVLKHPEGLWEIAYEPTVLQAEPIISGGNNWTHALATETRWKYFDPEWQVEVFVQPSCFDPGSVVPDTVCNAPFMREGDDLTYPTSPIPPEESLFTADVLERMCHTCNWSPGEGKTRVEWKWSGRDEHTDPKPVSSPMHECEMPLPNPVPSPPPSPAEVCEDSEVPLKEAQAACSHFTHDESLNNACIMDFCASGGNPVIPGLEEDEDEGTPMCVGSECDPKVVCEDSISLDLSTVKQNNLGGLGPDEGHESIVYGNVATVGGRAVDVVIECRDGSYSAWKPQMNGVNDGGMGTIAIDSGTTATLDFTFLDAELGSPVSLENIAFSVFDLDTGKKGKAAESVKLCGTNSAIVNSGSQLEQTVSGGCTKFKATEHGTAADNPSSPDALDSTQTGRTATFQLISSSTFTVELGIDKGHGQRLFMFAFHPAVACSD